MISVIYLRNEENSILLFTLELRFSSVSSSRILNPPAIVYKQYDWEICRGDIVGSRLNSLLLREPVGAAEMFEHEADLEMCVSWTGFRTKRRGLPSGVPRPPKGQWGEANRRLREPDGFPNRIPLYNRHAGEGGCIAVPG